MVKYFAGSVFETHASLIAHQVNCKGVMGAGLALQVRRRWPKVFSEYKDVCDKQTGQNLLGAVQVCRVDGEPYIRYCANCFGQYNYGTYQPMTNKKALEMCFVRLRRWCLDNGVNTIAVPYMIGCGLAGGNWDEVRETLHRIFNDDKITLEIWRKRQ